MATKISKDHEDLRVIPQQCASANEATEKGLPWVAIVASSKNAGKYFLEGYNGALNTFYLSDRINAINTARHRVQRALNKIKG